MEETFDHKWLESKRFKVTTASPLNETNPAKDLAPGHRSAIMFERGDMIVITGPQGSGKSTYAIEIAENFGTFARISLAEMSNTFALGERLYDEPDSLIVEADGDLQHSSALKEFLRQDTVIANRKNSRPKAVSRPLVLFVTTDHPGLIERGVPGRRVYVVRL